MNIVSPETPTIKTCKTNLTELWELGRELDLSPLGSENFYHLTMRDLKAVGHYYYCGDKKRGIPAHRPPDMRPALAKILYEYSRRNPKIDFQDIEQFKRDCWSRAHAGVEKVKEYDAHHTAMSREHMANANAKSERTRRIQALAKRDELAQKFPDRPISISWIARELGAHFYTVKKALLYEIEHGWAGLNRTPWEKRTPVDPEVFLVPDPLHPNIEPLIDLSLDPLLDCNDLKEEIRSDQHSPEGGGVMDQIQEFLKKFGDRKKETKPPDRAIKWDGKRSPRMLALLGERKEEKYPKVTSKRIAAILANSS